MKKLKFSDTQIVSTLEQADAGVPRRTLLAAEFYGRAGQRAGLGEGAGFGVAFAGIDHDGGLAFSLAVRVGVLDQAGLFLGAAQMGRRAGDQERSIALGHHERPRSASGQCDGGQADCKA